MTSESHETSPRSPSSTAWHTAACWLLLAIACITSIWLDPITVWIKADIVPRVAAVVAWFGWAAKPSLDAAHAASSPSAHGTYGIDEALIQIGMVLLISTLWFVVMIQKVRRHHLHEGGRDDVAAPWNRLPLPRRARRWLDEWGLVVLSSFPAIVFSVAMRERYVPAVFVMALVAIFVAAEHYGGQVENKQHLQEATDELQRILKDHQDKLGWLLNADGLAKWKNDVYERYLGATKRIDAVVRIFDIDVEWWAAKDDADWQDYRRCADTTLFKALTQVKAADSSDAPESPAAGTPQARRADAVQFVGDMPSPLAYGNAIVGGAQADAYARTFHKLLGLTWRLVVLGMVRDQRNGPRPWIGRPAVKVRIASSPSWMHAVDGTVFQVLERDDMDESSVRELTLEVRDGTRRKRLADWAHDDIRRHGERGADAEEYVCAVLHWAARRWTGLGPMEELNALRLGRVLTDLGMENWLDADHKNFCPEGVKRDDRTRLCLAVFQKFIEQRMSPFVCAVSRPPGHVRVRDLLLEVV